MDDLSSEPMGPSLLCETFKCHLDRFVQFLIIFIDFHLTYLSSIRSAKKCHCVTILQSLLIYTMNHLHEMNALT